MHVRRLFDVWVRLEAPEFAPIGLEAVVDRLRAILLDMAVGGPVADRAGAGLMAAGRVRMPDPRPTFHDPLGDDFALLVKRLAVAVGGPQPLTIELWLSRYAWEQAQRLGRRSESLVTLDASNYPIREPTEPIVFAPGGWGGDLLAAALPDLRRHQFASREEAGASPLLPTVRALQSLDSKRCFDRCGFCGRINGDPDDRQPDGAAFVFAPPTELLHLGFCEVCRRCVEILTRRVARPATHFDREGARVLLTDGNPPLVPFARSIHCSSCLSMVTTGDATLVAADHRDFALCAWCLHTAVERDAEIRGWPALRPVPFGDGI